MAGRTLLIEFLDDRKTLINAGKDEFQRVEFLHPTGLRQFTVIMIIGSEIVNLSKDVGRCSKREATSIYAYLLKKLDEDSDVIDLRPVLQNILDRRNEAGRHGCKVCLD